MGHSQDMKTHPGFAVAKSTDAQNPFSAGSQTIQVADEHRGRPLPVVQGLVKRQPDLPAHAPCMPRGDGEHDMHVVAGWRPVDAWIHLPVRGAHVARATGAA